MQDVFTEPAPKIKYELTMLEKTAGRIVSLSRGLDPLAQTVFLESFLLHARNLHAFLVKKPRRDDLSAGQFVENPDSWPNRSKTIFQEFGSRMTIGGIDLKHGYYDLMHKHLAHISKARTQWKARWPISGLCREVQSAFQVFLDSLSPERRTIFEEANLTSRCC
jgi:hypothetical protein